MLQQETTAGNPRTVMIAASSGSGGRALARRLQQAGVRVLGPLACADETLELSAKMRPDLAVIAFDVGGACGHHLALELLDLGVPSLVSPELAGVDLAGDFAVGEAQGPAH